MVLISLWLREGQNNPETVKAMIEISKNQPWEELRAYGKKTENTIFQVLSICS